MEYKTLKAEIMKINLYVENIGGLGVKRTKKGGQTWAKSEWK